MDMVLLGAGASVDAEMPAATEMAAQIVNHFRPNSRHRHALNLAIGGLLFQAGARGENPFDGVNVEDLFTAVESSLSDDTPITLA
jgi:hypothetical protein